MLKSEMEDAIAPYLVGNEVIKLVGVPRKGIVFQTSDTLQIPFSLLWCGFAIFWESSAIKMGAPFFFKLWGVPFVLAGIYFVIGRFVFDSWKRENTIYAITNDRVLIVTKVFSEKMTSIPSHEALCFKSEKHGNGLTTITFGRNGDLNTSIFKVQSWPGSSNHLSQLVQIEDGDEAIKMILNFKK
jgi:hypothetical protein